MRFKIKLELKKSKLELFRDKKNWRLLYPELHFHIQNPYSQLLRYFFNKKKFEASNNVNPNPNLILHNLSYRTIFIYNIFNELKLYI